MFLFGLVLLFGLLLLVASFLPENMVRSTLQDFRWSYNRYAILPLVVAACFATAYFEELFFRCYLPGELLRHGTSIIAASLAATLLFASGHLYQGFAGFTVAFVLGLYLSWARMKAGNIHAPALAHGFYNLGVLILSGLTS
jgi:membrane protease YdiL (CAAX protease family)